MTTGTQVEKRVREELDGDKALRPLLEPQLVSHPYHVHEDEYKPFPILEKMLNAMYGDATT